MEFSRRSFLKSGLAFSAGMAGLQSLMAREAFGSISLTGEASFGFGALVPDPNGIMDLPKGFSYKIISQLGTQMADGFLVPGAPDGMAAFPGPEGKTLLICNHELSAEQIAVGPFGAENQLLSKIDPANLYDFGGGTLPCLGGTTTMVFNTATQQMEKQFLSLAGTVRNCAGGPTPWNSWITCEETRLVAGGTYEEDHGYNFEVPALDSPKLFKPVALRDMGRFSHEAVAVEPTTGIVYQTEDEHDGLIYRFIPNVPGKLSAGGKLQALVIKDQPSFDTRNWAEPNLVTPGQKLAVQWLDVEDVTSPNGDLRLRGFTAGAARFARGEGMWYGNDAVYFACTNGGHKKQGQIWKYSPSPAEGQAGELDQPGMLELFVEPNDSNLIQNCDNLTVSPFGDLVVCEDGSGENFLIGVNPQGKIYRFARNVMNESELCGSCFSPDGSTLFVNIQHPGLTLAITGPWAANAT
ncbi:MAG: alkaline phosphatase PhoX [Sumerlaeia bacterium]